MKEEDKIVDKLLTSTETEWELKEPGDIFTNKKLKEIIDASRNERPDSSLYTHISIEKVDSKTSEKIKNLVKRYKKKDVSLKKISSGMKKALDRKNRKISKLLKYISLLESMLEENKIDFISLKQRIKDGEIHLTSRKIDTEIIEIEDIANEYIDAVEIELNDDGNEIT